MDQLDIFGQAHPQVVPKPVDEPGDSLAALIGTYGYDAVAKAMTQIKAQMMGPHPSVNVRTLDPPTSAAAAPHVSDVRKFGKQSHAGRLLAVYYDVGRFGLTDGEATNRVMGNPTDGLVSVGKWEGCRRRCSDLRAAEYIEPVPGWERNGREVCVITWSGRQAFAAMMRTGTTR